MVGTRQTIQRKRPKEGSQSRAEHAQFKCDWNECGPAVDRPTANVERITDRVCVPLHEVPAGAADNSAYQDHQRKPIFFAERLGQSFDGERRVSVDFAKSRCVRFLGSAYQFFVRRKLRQQPVAFVHEVVAFSGSATSSRVSEIEIIGTNLM